jgi:uncharacterized protein YjbI with pentapeptide repeats
LKLLNQRLLLLHRLGQQRRDVLMPPWWSHGLIQSVSSRPMSKRPTQSLKRQSQDPLPPEPPDSTVPELPEALTDHVDYEGFMLADAVLDEMAGAGVTFRRVHLRKCSLVRTELHHVEFTDVRFEACNLAGADWENARIARVAVGECAMVGARFYDASLDDLHVRDSNCDMALFWKARFARTRFERCTFRRASFEGADLSGVVFSECDLTGADLHNAKLTGTDFRGSRIDGIAAEARDLRGAIIAPDQAIGLVGLLGVTVKWEGE